VKQYQKFFEMEGAELVFTEESLKALAQMAMKRDTGARALRAIAEQVMIDLMYQLPDEPKGVKYVMTREIIEGKQSIFEARTELKKESA